MAVLRIGEALGACKLYPASCLLVDWKTKTHIWTSDQTTLLNNFNEIDMYRYYEEARIDGVLMWRNSPLGEFYPFSRKKLNERIVYLEEKLRASEEEHSRELRQVAIECIAPRIQEWV